MAAMVAGLILTSGLVAQSEDREEPSRQINRLGDSQLSDELDLELSVPESETAPGSLEYTLPDPVMDRELRGILAEVAANPGDEETANRLSDFLYNVIRGAETLGGQGQFEQAEQMLGVVRSVDPGFQGLNAATANLERKRQIIRSLARANKALEEGRIDQPASNSAWFHFRAVLDLDSDNPDAKAGLMTVQREMIAEALEYARDLDFESAERMMEDAALVRPSDELIQQGYEEIHKFRKNQAQDLETRAVVAMDAGRFDEAERLLIDLVALGEMDMVVSQLRRRMEEAKMYGGFKPGQVVRDHFLNRPIWTPESVIVLAGSFNMGSSAFEDGRRDNEGPRHRVTFRRGFAMGKTEVTVAQFRQFVETTGYKTDAEKHRDSTVYDHYSGRLTPKEGIYWEHNYEGKKASEDEPVVHVSWNDAYAYVRWMANGTGKRYRLPSEAEFEYALRAGSNSRYWWGDGSPTDVVENLTGENDTSRGRRQWSTNFAGYGDNYWGPAPVGSFKPNPNGLYDIGGNVGEWVMDCWHDSFIRAPEDGSAWVNPGCENRVIRGAYWASSPDQARSAYRVSAQPIRRDARIGFRILRDL